MTPRAARILLTVFQGLVGIALGLAFDDAGTTSRLWLLIGGVAFLLLSAWAVEWLDHFGRKRPRLDVRYSWKEGEDKDQTFEFVNVGDEEARNIQVQPIRLGSRILEIRDVPRLLPGGPSVLRNAEEQTRRTTVADRTLVDAIEAARAENALELKAKAAAKQNLTEDEQFIAAFEAERTARANHASITVTVAFTELGGTSIEQTYALEVTSWARATDVLLQFVSEREMRRPANMLMRLARFVTKQS